MVDLNRIDPQKVMSENIKYSLTLKKERCDFTINFY